MTVFWIIYFLIGAFFGIAALVSMGFPKWSTLTWTAQLLLIIAYPILFVIIAALWWVVLAAKYGHMMRRGK